MFPNDLARSYLFAYLYWWNLSLGCLGVLMLHQLVGGRWGFVIRRILEAGTRTLPLMALLFVPIALSAPVLYPLERPPLGYFAPCFFYTRAAVYFSVWLALAALLNLWSRRQDQTGATAGLQRLSAPGLILYGLTVTFAAIDWGMALDPHWFSTMYGVIFMVAQGLSAFSFAAVAVARLNPSGVTAQALHDLGNLMLAFVLLWTYVSFAQYLIIWSANLPEEIPWYLERSRTLPVVLVLIHFAVPFLLLLSRHIKRSPTLLLAVAVILLLARFVDLYWILGLRFSPRDLGLPAIIGALWLAVFVWQVRSWPLLPLRDPRFTEATHA